MTSKTKNKVLVRVNNIGKIFCRDLKKSLFYGATDSIRDITRWRGCNSLRDERPLRVGEFWANKGISFELRRGECLGLIGHNGAGKTTLLKMLNGLIKPDYGSIEMRGKVSALIALGAGFNPILTGRENVYINGSVLGLAKREIHQKMDEIIDFAEIREFIDSPVQTYSSGMQVRLGFAVAAVLIKPDVLILDEVLAVGDMRFTIKCLNAIRQLASNTAVIFVSHNVQMISQFCSQIMLLKHGEVQLLTSQVSDGIDAYLQDGRNKVDVSGTGEVLIDKEVLCSQNGGNLLEKRNVCPDDHLVVKFTLDIAKSVELARVMIVLKDNSGRPIAAYTPLDASGMAIEMRSGKHHCFCELGSLSLTPGKYHLVLAVKAFNPDRFCARKEGVTPFTVASNHASEAGSYTYAPISRLARTTVSSD